MAAEKITPFAWIDAITTKKGDPMEEHGEKAYPAFMINRGLSYYPDCVLHAAEINMFQDLPAKMAYDYYRQAIRPGKRFAKWGKKKKDDDLTLVMEHYKINRIKASAALRILTPEQINTIRETQEAGTDN